MRELIEIELNEVAGGDQMTYEWGTYVGAPFKWFAAWARGPNANEVVP